MMYRDKLSVWTTNQENSWFAVDLGESRKVAPIAYTIRYSSSGNNCCIRNWELQATNNPLLLEDPNIDPTGWTVLDKHTDDATIDGEFAEHVFTLNGTFPKFRAFRILQTGKNKIGKLFGDSL